MKDIHVYIPDDLHKAAQKYNINMSLHCRECLRRRVEYRRKIENLPRLAGDVKE